MESRACWNFLDEIYVSENDLGGLGGSCKGRLEGSVPFKSENPYLAIGQGQTALELAN
jgi:hypothetical protein